MMREMLQESVQQFKHELVQQTLLFVLLENIELGFFINRFGEKAEFNSRKEFSRHNANSLFKCRRS